MKKQVTILRGGPSSEYEVSLKSGRAVIEKIAEKYNIKDIVIDKNGDWVLKGIVVKPESILNNTDVVLNAMHGEYGEDGQVQQILQTHKVPFTGPTTLGAKLSINKDASKKIYKKHGIKTPEHRLVENIGDPALQAFELFRSMPMPVIIKPVDLGSSVGLSIARDYKSLLETLISLYKRYDRLLVEEYIEGREATVGVIEKFRDKEIYPLLPIEIITPDHIELFDYDAKYSGEVSEVSPGNFNSDESKMLQELAVQAHEALGLRHYSRSDFILHPKRGIYLLETNSLPGLTDESLFPKSLEPVGSSFEEFLDHVIELALNGK